MFFQPLVTQQLAMRAHPHLRTHVEHRTSRTTRQGSRADMFAKWNQEAVDLDPIWLREYGFERLHGAFWRESLHVSPAVGHTVNMYINTDRWLMAGNAQNQIGAFGTHATERAQQIGITGQRTAVYGGKMACYVMNLLGLGVVEGTRANGLVNGFRGELSHRRWRARFGKQPMGARQRHVVTRPNGNDAGHEQFKG